MKSTFIKTLSAIIAIVLAIIAGYLIVLFHDATVSRNYPDNAKLDSDNNWGALMVDVDVETRSETKSRFQPSPECLEKEELEKLNGKKFSLFGSECYKKPNLIQGEGEYTVTGTIYIKNRQWVSSTKIPDEIIKWGKVSNTFDENNKIIEGSPTIYNNIEYDGFKLGSYLGARRGASAKFIIKVPVDGQVGNLFLIADNKQVEVK